MQIPSRNLRKLLNDFFFLCEFYFFFLLSFKEDGWIEPFKSNSQPRAHSSLLNIPYTLADQRQILEWKYKKKSLQVHKDPRDVVMWIFSPFLPTIAKIIIIKSLFSKSNVTGTFVESPPVGGCLEEKRTPRQDDDASPVATTSSSKVECFI